MVASASMDVALLRYGSGFYFFLRQLLFILFGLFIVFLVAKVPTDYWYQYSLHLLLFSFVLLVLVLIIGKEVNGSTRWIPIGPINVQPSEIAKLLIIIYMASYLSRHQQILRSSWWSFIKPLIILLFVAFLLLAEPDFGALVVLSSAVLGVVFLAGVQLKQFFFLVALSLITIALVAISQPYRMARFVSYLDPWAYPYSGGYQLTQSLIAFGRGGFWGEGLGNSIQKQFYLPEAHTDFIFAVISEEFGLVGALFVVVLFIFVLIRALNVGYEAMLKENLFSAYLVYGIVLLLGGQVFINIGVNTGILPTKGLALPFISYGGSNLMFCSVAVGLLLRVDVEQRKLN